VFIVPFILFVGLIGYDFARIFHVKKMAQALSREIAVTAYRECPSLTIIDSGVENPDDENCLDRIRNSFEAYAASLSTEPTIVLSFYDDGGLGGGGGCSIGNQSCRVSRSPTTRYSRYDSGSARNLLGQVSDKNSILIAEVYLKYTSFFDFNIFQLIDIGIGTKSFEPWNKEDSYLYDVTVV
jgi:hypothetical protein